ncbi:MAG: HDOD domain-containing protein [Gammaproteobacteria bacterium]|nr:HDOD domain-containing protein [Gammaproteobacteria bacterium]
MDANFIEEFWQDLSEDIRKNRIALPSLPEITLKTRKLLDNQNTNANMVARAISADAVLTTRLIRVANSPLYRGSSHIDDVRTAVTRLGNLTVRHIVTNLAMQTLYQCSLPPQIRKLLVESWEHSLVVASIAYFLARKTGLLNPDEAMLAGLIHDIGTLPILEYAELYPELLKDDTLLHQVIMTLHPRVGEMILRTWEFAPALVSAVADHELKAYNPVGITANYTDLVITANLLSSLLNRRQHRPQPPVDWANIPSFRRLNLMPEETIASIREAREELVQIQQLFKG